MFQAQKQAETEEVCSEPGLFRSGPAAEARAIAGCQSDKTRRVVSVPLGATQPTMENSWRSELLSVSKRASQCPSLRASPAFSRQRKNRGRRVKEKLRRRATPRKMRLLDRQLARRLMPLRRCRPTRTTLLQRASRDARGAGAGRANSFLETIFRARRGTNSTRQS